MDNVTLRRFGSEKCIAVYFYQPTVYSGVIPRGLYCTLGYQVIEIIMASISGSVVSVQCGAGVPEEHPLDSTGVLVLPDPPDRADAHRARHQQEAAGQQQPRVEGGLLEADLLRRLLSLLLQQVPGPGQGGGVKSQVRCRHHLETFDHINRLGFGEHISDGGVTRLGVSVGITTLPRAEELREAVGVQLQP